MDNITHSPGERASNVHTLSAPWPKIFRKKSALRNTSLPGMYDGRTQAHAIIRPLPRMSFFDTTLK